MTSLSHRVVFDEEICPTSIGNTSVLARRQTVFQTKANCFGRNPWCAKSKDVFVVWVVGFLKWEVSSTRPSQVRLEVAWITRIHPDNKIVAAYTNTGCFVFLITTSLGIHSSVFRVIINAAWPIIPRVTDEVWQDSKDRVVLRIGFAGTQKLEVDGCGGGTNWKTGNISGRKKFREVIPSIRSPCFPI